MGGRERLNYYKGVDMTEIKKQLNKPIELSTNDGNIYEGVLKDIVEQEHQITLTIPINIKNENRNNMRVYGPYGYGPAGYGATSMGNVGGAGYGVPTFGMPGFPITHGNGINGTLKMENVGGMGYSAPNSGMPAYPFSSGNGMYGYGTTNMGNGEGMGYDVPGFDLPGEPPFPGFSDFGIEGPLGTQIHGGTGEHFPPFTGDVPFSPE